MSGSSSRRLPTLRIRPGEVAERVLVVGDPERAAQAAGRLDDCRRVGAHREYVTYTGVLGGRAVSVCSHGIGSAGAGICFEELARAGARILVRAGTCGALDDELADGDLVVVTAAVRDDGLTPRLVPLGYPAACDPEVVLALGAAAERAGVRHRRGIALTTDLFYPSRALGLDWRVWLESRVAAVEMEMATLLIVAALHGLRAGGALTVDGHPARAAGDMSEYDPHRPVVAAGVSQMLDVALAGLTAIEL